MLRARGTHDCVTLRAALRRARTRVRKMTQAEARMRVASRFAMQTICTVRQKNLRQKKKRGLRNETRDIRKLWMRWRPKLIPMNILIIFVITSDTQVPIDLSFQFFSLSSIERLEIAMRRERERWKEREKDASVFFTSILSTDISFSPLNILANQRHLLTCQETFSCGSRILFFLFFLLMALYVNAIVL